MVSNSEHCISVNDLENSKAKVANRSFIDIKGIESIHIKINNVLYNLVNGLHIPDVTSSLFGIKNLVSCTGLKILLNKNIGEAFDILGNSCTIGIQKGHLYYLHHSCIKSESAHLPFGVHFYVCWLCS
ncbi:hypothetical protein O9G_004804 [Rozella allomycis CSF55]|uniref:Uncharacterized protein n=1 Tax=Rozella allomycis (strain CSF55) TaxID=988480 RepID=A0A075AVA5_ROZAC|nr:hypothetical protein O9G_004804 [Rozella allomycis CSF55]|eukprot:EPZ32484.1 hypothetical protein O9G_004804 [Rozella allomycis CSF55]